jgi:Flp pilus assembly protein TadD
VFGPDGAKQVAAALAEYVRAQTINGDRPEAHLNLSSVAIERKDLVRAEAEARTALRLEPAYSGAYLNLADILRMRADEKGAVQVLRDGLRVAPDDATLHHALGLALVRARRPAEALPELARASELAPDNSRFVVAHALALNDGGARDAALAVLGEAHRRHAGDADLLMMLVSLHRDAGHSVQALAFAEKLAALVPGNPQVAELVRSLK